MGDTYMKVLECSSVGDIRFSAFEAKIKIMGRLDSIENHYQLSKRFGNKVPSSWREAKGKNHTHININGIDYDKSLTSQWYKLLWCIYLDKNPNLVEYARGYDNFRDSFKGKSVNCQADVIKQYVQNGRQSVLDDCTGLLRLINENNIKRKNGTIK
jgi:hypothetical protein